MVLVKLVALPFVDLSPALRRSDCGSEGFFTFLLFCGCLGFLGVSVEWKGTALLFLSLFFLE